MNSVRKSAEAKVETILNKLKSAGLTCSPHSEKKYNFEFSISGGDKTFIKILVYFGKKGVKTVLQGDNKSELFKKVNNIIFDETLFEFETGNNEIDEPENYIGTDESGKGDYFGPLVIAAVAVNRQSNTQLKKLGVKDSKEISDNTINLIANKIKSVLAGSYNVIIITPEKYNELYLKFKNLNGLLAWGHAKAIENILEQKPDINEVICDKFGNEKFIIGALQRRGKTVILHQYTKAEKYTAVAAASILAREAFNRWFENKEKLTGVKLPKGSSKDIIEAANMIVSKFGADEMKKFAKIHFKTTNKILLK